MAAHVVETYNDRPDNDKHRVQQSRGPEALSNSGGSVNTKEQVTFTSCVNSERAGRSQNT